MRKITKDLIVGLASLAVLAGPIGVGGAFNFSNIEIKSNFDMPDMPEAPSMPEMPEVPEVPEIKDLLKGEYVEDEIVVKFKGDVKPFRVIKVPQGQVGEKLAEYLKRKDVEYAEPNYLAYALMKPNDPYYSYQWHFDNSAYGGINLEAAWDISAGSGVAIAVVDSGISQGTDLANTCFVSGYDFVSNDSNPSDDNGHGTHIAGTVAQSTNNNHGVAGIAFNACLMPVKVLNRYGSGSYSDVADGIRWATDHGADVINLSLGGSASSQTLENAVAYAYNHGVVVVAAAGNSGSSSVNYPAGYDDYVIAVGATQYDENIAPYSNRGSSLDLVAPGGNSNLDQNNDGYGDGILQQTFSRRYWRTTWGYYFMQGTSMATGHVSGVAALVLANGNAGSPDEVRAALETTADDLGAAGRDNTYGWGLVNAYAALNWSAGPPAPVDNPPTVDITLPLNGVTVSGVVTITADAADDNGVSQVEFFVDGGSIGIDSAPPYNVSWNSASVSDGSHTIKATATDTAPQTASDSISVTVDNENDSPIANAGPDQIVSDDDGTGSELVNLDGSGSADSDGTIVSYEWKEGSTLLGSGVTPTVDLTVGIHIITLMVTDNEGAIGNDEVVVNVLANQSPTANAGPDKSAYVGETVNFDGSGSADSDGSIVSYYWDFDDGNDDTGVATSHAYSTAGTYTVTLTVTDNGGLTDQDTAIVTISEVPAAPTAWLNIGLSKQTVWRWWRVTATVTVRENNASGSLIEGATVKGTWSGAYNGSVSGTTNSSGQVSFRTNYIRTSGTLTFTVTQVTKGGQDYLLDGETSDSISHSSSNGWSW